MVSGQYVRLPFAKGCRIPSIADDVFTERYKDLSRMRFMRGWYATLVYSSPRCSKWSI